MSRVQDIIADVIIKRLEKGTIPWKPTWRLQAPQNYISKKPYNGLNMLLLSMQEYKFPYYLTFKQIQALRAYVKHGEKGHIITYYAKSNNNKDDEDGSDKQDSKKIKTFLRYYTVFNIEQTTIELDDMITGTDMIKVPKIDSCVSLINNICDLPRITHTGFNPCYNKHSDEIILPQAKNFDSIEHYYSALFHELTHSTGHLKRLNRPSLTTTNRFGSNSYSEEELVAEIGAFMLCCECGISHNTVDNQMAYISGWLNALKNNKGMIFKASSQAKKAYEYLLNTSQLRVAV